MLSYITCWTIIVITGLAALAIIGFCSYAAMLVWNSLPLPQISMFQALVGMLLITGIVELITRR